MSDVIYIYRTAVHEWVDGKPVTVPVEVAIDLDRLLNDVAYHIVRGKRGTVTRARGAIVVRRVKPAKRA